MTAVCSGRLSVAIGGLPVIATGLPSVEGCADGAGRSLSTRPCSRGAVLASETRVRNLVSRPSAMTATAARTAVPKPRLIHSPAPSDRFIAAKTRPPMTSASASDVATPAA